MNWLSVLNNVQEEAQTSSPNLPTPLATLVHLGSAVLICGHRMAAASPHGDYKALCQPLELLTFESRLSASSDKSEKVGTAAVDVGSLKANTIGLPLK